LQNLVEAPLRAGTAADSISLRLYAAHAVEFQRAKEILIHSQVKVTSMTALTPIALQLYTVREALERDFEGTIRTVANIGFAGVETAGFPGTTPEAAAHLFKELGLTVCGAHAPLPLGDNRETALATMRALGSTRLVCAWQPAELFQSVASIRQVCATLNEASRVALDNGLTLGYHNHDAEYAALDGKLAHDHLRECLAPEVFFEPDTYWIRTAGVDPAAELTKLGKRAPLVHIKDGPAVRGEPMLALGDGVIDIPAIVAASAGHAEWLIVELDQCATDMLEAVRRSFNYLVANGLGRGRA
jgi:sugar phosphate isomerase/epimerase